MERKNREELLATRDSLEESFRVQLNTYDSYQTEPTLFDRPGPVIGADEFAYYQVPVVRVFGSLPTGHTILAHIHGVLPYFYIPYEKRDCFALLLQLEAAVAASFKRADKDGEGEATDAKDEKENDKKLLRYIAHVSICKGVPIYGYHVGYQPFFKISLLNPSYRRRVADLLRDGALGKRYEVFESHIPYSLQFLTDYNLFGCGWLRLDNVFIRTPILLNESLKTDNLVEYMMGYHPTDIPRMGRCQLEIDTLAQNILNRHDLQQRELHSDFLEKMHHIPRDDIYIQSTKDLWKDGEFQRKAKGEAQYCSPPSVVRHPDIKWVDSKENQELFDYVKNLNTGDRPLHFETFVKKNPAMEKLPTAFENVSELFYEPQIDDHEGNHVNVSVDGVSSGASSDNFYGIIDDEYDAEQAMLEEIDAVLEREPEDEEKAAQSPVYSGDESSDDSMNHQLTVENISDIQLTQHLSRKFGSKRNFTVAFEQETSQNLTSLNNVKLIGDYRYTPQAGPPKYLDFVSYGLPIVQYDDPFYMEAPPKPYVYAGKKFKLESKLLEHLPPVKVDGESIPMMNTSTRVTLNGSFQTWRYMKAPPNFYEVEDYLYEDDVTLTQIGVNHDYKFSTQHTIERRPDGFNDLTIMIVEIFAPTRDDFNPDPSHDPVLGIFWKTIQGNLHDQGLFTLHAPEALIDLKWRVFDDELVMFEEFAAFVCKFDPDIIAGYEVHASSWGYLIDRGRAKFAFEFMHEISRVTSKSRDKMGDHWGYTHTSSIRICGRHVLNIWRPLKEMKLSKNTIEYVAYHLLHERIPHYTHKTLTHLYQSNYSALLDHFKQRLDINARLIESGEMILRAAEEARLIGIDFYDVYYRGSQYKVESLLTRIAKAENFMLSSPSRKQVRHQKPLECIPLVMEPISAYYKSPLLVLDFQSLYPSIVIAYNYCYSTLLGRMRNYSGSYNKVGTGRVKHPEGLLKLLENDITLSPNGLMFTKATVRKSLLAKMLEDILDTRFMVKSTMKFLDSNLKQLYNNRQLALKLTANVTYGYTSASFSGRMPCSDIADAIVQTGRETLERAIELIESDANWGAKVVYGDTDSLFVYLPGRSREDAFRMGKEMAEAVTKSNPDPVTLKFEKVYHPSILMAKKRYVGYSYENQGSEAKFDAKGIETVRRDGHPAQQHIVEQCLRTLFETNNVTEIKTYVLDQFNKIINNDVSIQDFCFARAVRIGAYKNPPPGAIVSEKKMKEDARAEPQYKERVPYVIIEEGGSILRERARSPEDFIKNHYKLDSEYYIVKTLIPPLERIFNLIGVDVRQWYTDMPKQGKKAVSIYNRVCLSCGTGSKSILCGGCKNDELQTILNLKEGMKHTQTRLKNLLTLCRACCSGNSVYCESHDCSLYFSRVRAENKLQEKEEVKNELAKLIEL